MKNNKANSRRWFKQAQYDLSEAEKCFKDRSFAYCCFFAEQSSQKVLKAFLIYKGERFINIHSVAELLKEAEKYDGQFTKLVEPGKTLDKYYLTARYPDAIPEPAVPYEIYTEKEAKEALECAGQIVDLCQSLIR